MVYGSSAVDQMTSDVMQLLVVTTFVVLMFTSGTYVLYQKHDDDAHGRTELGDACAEFVAMRGRVDRWDHLLFAFANAAIDGTTHAACLMEELPQHWALAWLYFFTFNVLTVVLLLNLLIAMMAKTFDNVWEASEVNHQFLFARLVRSQQTRPPEPPPLTLLRGPVTLVALLLISLSALLEALMPRRGHAYAIVTRAKEFVLAGFEYSSFLNIAKELERRRLGLEAEAEASERAEADGVDGGVDGADDSFKGADSKPGTTAATGDDGDQAPAAVSSATLPPSTRSGLLKASALRVMLALRWRRGPARSVDAQSRLTISTSSRRSAGIREATASRSSSISRHASGAAAANLGMDGEYVGIEFNGRNTFQAWRASLTPEDLREHCSSFIAKHENDVAQEQRWRSNMVKRIGEMLEESEARISRRLDTHFGEQARTSPSASPTGVPAASSQATVTVKELSALSA